MSHNRGGCEMDSFLKTLGKTIVLLLCGSLAIAAVVHAVNGDAALVTACGVLSIFAFLAARIEMFESLSGFGLRAKIRQLDETIVRADEVLAKLRQTAAILSRNTLDNLARIGRMGSPTVRQAWEVANGIKQQLRDLGVPEQEIREALSPWSSWLVLDIAFGVADRFGKAIGEAARKSASPGNVEEKRAAEIQAQVFIRDRIGNAYFNSVPTDYPERLYAIARDAPFVTPEVRQRFLSIVDDVAAVIVDIRDKQEIPSPDIWLDNLQRIRRYQWHSPDPLDWRANKLEDD